MIKIKEDKDFLLDQRHFLLDISVKATISCMKVVNDVSERAVALMDDYNKLHANNEEQNQFLLLVVQHYRKKYPNRNKSTLIQN